MRFLADVNIPQSVIRQLRLQGYEVLDAKIHLLSAPDTQLIKKAQKEKRIILTKDKDFISLTQFPKHRVPTIVVRLQNQKPKHIHTLLLQLLQHQSEKVLNKSLTILREDSAKSQPF